MRPDAVISVHSRTDWVCLRSRAEISNASVNVSALVTGWTTTFRSRGSYCKIVARMLCCSACVAAGKLCTTSAKSITPKSAAHSASPTRVLSRRWRCATIDSSSSGRSPARVRRVRRPRGRRGRAVIAPHRTPKRRHRPKPEGGATLPEHLSTPACKVTAICP